MPLESDNVLAALKEQSAKLIIGGPFGQPDGARVNLTDRSFVRFPDAARWGALATEDSDLKARFLVGRKGSGKTIYLRRIEAHNVKQPDIFSVQQDVNPISTTEVVEYFQRFSTETVTEGWQQIWRLAILRSVAGVLLLHPGMLGGRHRLKEGEITQIKQALTVPGLDELKTPLSIYDNLRVLMSASRSQSHAYNLLRRTEWLDLTTLLKLYISKYPTLCFYLDSVDDEFQHAPLFWMRCQKGLLYATMRLLRDPEFGNRIHVFVCLRDLVLTSVRESEHLTRYEEDEHIRRLDWDLEAARYFLYEKLKVLDARWLLAPAEPNLIERWIGFSHIPNESYGIEEAVDLYILRHTRLLPRDIVILGNAVCSAIARGKLALTSADKYERFRDIVFECASLFAAEQILICCNQISSDQTPPGAARFGINNIYTAMSEYQATLADQLREIIKKIGKAEFTADEARQQTNNVDGTFHGVDPFNAMWQNGMIGCMRKHSDKSHVIFYTAAHAQSIELPESEDGYVFHPSLSAAFRLPSAGGSPVIPYQN